MNPFNTESGNMAKTSGNIHALSAISEHYFIIDSGAMDHMCSSPHMLFDVASSASYPLIIVINGVHVLPQGVGQL